MAQSPTPSTPTTGSTTTAPKEGQNKPFIDNLAKILGKDADQVESAVKQAWQETVHAKADQVLQARLDQLVKNGKITQVEADTVLSWFVSRPAAADSVIGRLGPGGGPLGRHGHHGFGHMRPGRMLPGAPPQAPIAR